MVATGGNAGIFAAMPSPRTLALALCLAAAASTCGAQTFIGLAEAGAAFSQVEGDDLAGFNRIGARAGIGVLTDLSDKWRASLTIAYAQHGSRSSAREVPRVFDAIRLDYVAVPVAAHYLDWLSDDQEYYRLEFIAGLEYRRLVTSQALDVTGGEIDFDFADNAGAVMLGAYYAWSLNWAAGFFYDFGITPAQADAREQNQQTQQVSLRLRRLF